MCSKCQRTGWLQDRCSNFSLYSQHHSLAWQFLHKSILCSEHNWDLGGRGLNSIPGDLCWELKQVQCGTWLSLQLALSVVHPPFPSGIVSPKGPRSGCLLLQSQTWNLLPELLPASCPHICCLWLFYDSQIICFTWLYDAHSEAIAILTVLSVLTL